MAKKKGDKDRNLERQLENLLQGLGLGGDYTFLIDKAVREDWSFLEFETALRHTPRFQRDFRGIFERGTNINPFLSPGNNLGEAIRNYRQLEFSYGQVLRNFGRGLTSGAMETLLGGAVSPDELGTRLEAIRRVRDIPGLADAFNQQLRDAGLKTLDRLGLFRFVAGASSREFYDAYEAAQLRVSGIDIRRGAAAGIARETELSPEDIAELARQIRAYRGDIGPELAEAGITEADIARFETGQNTRLGPILQGIIANRRALGRRVPGPQPRRGAGGGLAIYPEEQPLSAL